MPSPAAWARGQEAARKILDAHVADTGEYPETVAVRNGRWLTTTVLYIKFKANAVTGFIGREWHVMT